MKDNETKTIREAIEDFDAAVGEFGRSLYRALVPWYVKARISADEEIATSQARAEKARDEARHQHDWWPYIVMACGALGALMVWLAIIVESL